MFKILLKKQISELFSWMLRKNSLDKKGSSKGLILYAGLYLYLFGMFGWTFWQMASALCEPLCEMDLGWLYFAMLGLIATTLGVMGSVFTAYSMLYQARDNELLLSMPIPPALILAVRLFAVYVMSFFFEAVVLVPSALVYLMKIECTVAAVLCNVLICFLLPLLTVVFSGILGWLIAFVASKTRHYTLITVLISLGFFAGYYYLYMLVYGDMQLLMLGGESTGKGVKMLLYPFYQMGIAAQGSIPGSIPAMLIFTAIVLVLFFVVYLCLAKSFHKIVTMKKCGVKAEYKEKAMKERKPTGALLAREAKRFCSNANYLMNCGLGTLILIVGTVAALFFGGTIKETISGIYPEMQEMLPLLIAVGVAGISAMNTITAPSVSLEGNTLWLLRSLPVTTWQVLEAKLLFHILVTGIPAFICAEVLVLTCGVVQSSMLAAILVPVCCVLFVYWCAAFGLLMNLKFPSLDWTNEAAVVKQSMSVVFALFVPWVVLLLLGGLWFVSATFMQPEWFLLLVAVLLEVACIMLRRWLRTKGVKAFEVL